MDLGLTDKVAVVLSASKGLGRACATTLAAEGARVAICSRNADNLAEAKTAVHADTGRDIVTKVADVSRPDEVTAFVDHVRETLGPVSILVTNSGGPPPGPVADTSWEQWDAAIALLLHSAHTAIGAVLPDMRERRWGRILLITSVAVKQPISGLGLSNAVRAAVTGYAKTLATEVAPDGITVNCLCPGYIRTERIEQLAAAQASAQGITPEEAIARNMTADMPIGRLGKLEELGAVAAFVASEQAAFITGVSIAVDGGLTKGLLG